MAIEDSIEEGIIEDEAERWDSQRASAGPTSRRRQSSHRTVVSQATRVVHTMTYRHTLALECGHTEFRTGGQVGARLRRVKCSTCATTASTPPVAEESRPRGWWERFIPGRGARNTESL